MWCVMGNSAARICLTGVAANTHISIYGRSFSFILRVATIRAVPFGNNLRGASDAASRALGGHYA